MALQPQPQQQLMTDDEIFNTPQDLVCAITQDLFLDPVINALGQVGAGYAGALVCRQHTAIQGAECMQRREEVFLGAARQPA